tara:strand:+ start:155 stop:763 length:609 start_codon:yes stop_codon:yes gene_type:complete
MQKLPEYIADENFNQSAIQELLKSGELPDARDSYDNITFSMDAPGPTSKLEEHVLLIKTERRKIIPPQLETHYPTNVVEYADSVITEAPNAETDIAEGLGDVMDDMQDIMTGEQLLQAQVDELSDKLDEEMASNIKFREDSMKTYAAAKDTIIAQRIAAGEGTTPTEFSDDFPFLPKSETQQENDIEIRTEEALKRAMTPPV